MDHGLTLALPQLAPSWLNKDAGIAKVVKTITEAAKGGADLIVFSESFIPGYPFWLDATGGAVFNSEKQKELFAFYAGQAVIPERGDLAPICEALKSNAMAAYVGIIERAADRSGHSLYCSYVYIDKGGIIRSVHRKLQPTYEERLVWAPGDGAGLVTHKLGNFTVGGLNCWENWMPLSRAALYAQGEDLHIACWPGNARNTEDLTPVLAKEGRSYCVSVSAIMRPEDVLDDVPFAGEIRAGIGAMPANGGSCIAAPDGSWVLEPLIGEEGIRYAQLDPAFVRRERQNFDPAGHYSRPDVTRLVVNRKRQSLVEFE
ncbi:MAG: carbon-nitrogen hydrolase family protein [Maricaulaceae bacterium]